MIGSHRTPARAGAMRGDPFERMYSIVKELLWRQRQIQPFPCDKAEVLASILPVEMCGYAHKPTPMAGLTVEWQNLTHCISVDNAVVVELDGETGKAFWMRFGYRVPAPSQSAAFNLPPTNQYYGQLFRWWERASVIHEELKLYQTALWDFLQRANHPKLVEKYWLELFQFIDFQLHPGGFRDGKEPNLSKRRLMPLPSEADRNGIIETLAASTLLQVMSCDAWVDYEVEEV